MNEPRVNMRGGDVWQRGKYGPRAYVIPVESDLWILASLPEAFRSGACACSALVDGEWKSLFTTAQLTTELDANWHHVGELKDILAEPWNLLAASEAQ